MDISTPRSNLVVRFLTVFLLCCTSLYASADQTGKQKITVVASDVTLETVFKQIEKQTGLRFMYAVDAVDVKEKVTVAFEKVMLDEVLGMLLGKKGIEWVYREGVISLKLHQTKSFVLELADPPINVSGKILDAKGTPIPGATVMIKGGRKGTKTDGDGIFTLSGVSLNSILLITHIGFESKEVVANKNIITIHMNEIAGILDETVIVGYGTTTQRFNTGNVTSIKGDDITKNPVSNVLVALQGKVPGMNITQTTGLPGGQIKVQIRGQNSIKNGTVPLFIVDGVPYEPSVTTTTFGNYGALGDVISALNFINPSDIESIDVLKDADATAIYGSRGANGVVLITTKKGSTSETRVEVNVNQGWQSLAHKQKLLTTKEYLQVRREAFSNDNEVPTIENAPDLLLWDTTRYTNWQDVLIGGTASYTDAQASVSGGSNVVSFMMGGNFHRETTVFPGDFNSQRGGGHFSIMSTTPNQRLRASIIGNYTINKNSYPGQDFASKISLPPNAPPIYNSDGSLNWANSTWENPFSQLVSEKSESETNNFVVNVLLNYRFTDALMFKMNIGYNEVRNNTFSASLIEGRPPQDINTARAFATYLNSKLTAWISEPQITYNKDFGKGAINTMIGATLLSNSIDGNYLFTADILQDALVRFPASAGSYRIFGNGSKYKYVGLFGRAGFIWDAKYMVNLTVRRDGSSRFGPRERFANFGSIGVGWIFSQEKFVQDNLPFLSFGKLRGSYGITGNDQIGNYQYLDQYDFVENLYQNRKGVRVLGLFNPDFTWERTRKSELGAELGFLKDKIFLTVSYYKNISDNQLLSYSLPSMVGNSSIVGNRPITVRNNGLEFTLAYSNIKHRLFEWASSWNISVSRNKILSDNLQILEKGRVGKSLSNINLYRSLGVNSETGEYQFSDIDGKPIVGSLADPSNANIDLAPNFFGGVQNTFRFKAFQLDVFFQYVNQKGVYSIFNPNAIPGSIGNQPREVLELSHWKKDGDVAEAQRYNQNSNLLESYGVWLNSTANYGNASFLRCKNLMFSWKIPNNGFKQKYIKDWRVYIQGQNVFTITKYKGGDPEIQSFAVVPPLRVFTTGLQLTL